MEELTSCTLGGEPPWMHNTAPKPKMQARIVLMPAGENFDPFKSPVDDIARHFMNIAAALLLSACASAGIKVSDQQYSSFTPGTSTFADVIAALDDPSSDTEDTNSTRSISYTYAEVSTRPPPVPARVSYS